MESIELTYLRNAGHATAGISGYILTERLLSGSDEGSADYQNLFVTPASGKEAASHVVDSVANPISKVSPSEFFDDNFLKDARDPDTAQYFAWGARPGKRNSPYWDALKPNDYILFYQNKRYTFVAQVLAKADNQAFAAALWGLTDAGEAWRHVYFLTQPIRIDVPIERVSEYLQDVAYQNFMKITPARIQGILADYGSLDDFVAARLINAAEIPTKFFLLRRNAESVWDDQDHVYNFGSTVANWKKLVVGSRVILDEKSSAGAMITGIAEVGSIEEVRPPQKPRSFYAHLTNFVKIEPARGINPNLFGQIRSLPGYNAQHSIRPITQEIFDAIVVNDLPSLQSFSLLPDPNEDLAHSLYWSSARTSRLIQLFNRSKQILFGGPPGTGKTFIATALAEAATISHTHRRTIQFHPSYAYEDFVEGIRPILAPSGTGREETLRYELARGALKRFSESAADDPLNRYVLVIDEINRANVARVFGELLYCLEYRGPAKTVELPYSRRLFFLPENLWILATMNTADRSIAPLDAAFRRRFHQWTLAPDYEAMNEFFRRHDYTDQSRSAITRIRRLNDELLNLVGEEKLIGQSFFMKADHQEIDFEAIWAEDLEPVLREHLYNRIEEMPKLRAAFLDDGL